MFRISMHYYSTDHAAIIGQILRREKKAIQNFKSEFSLNNQMVSAFESDNRQLIQPPSLDDFMEIVVVKKWDNILSVYPLICTPEQMQNESWVKHDTRKSSVTQKYASLFVGQNEKETHIEFWRTGKYVCDSNIALTDNSVTTLIDLRENCNDLYQKWVKAAPDSYLIDELPLFLPPNWKDEWSYAPCSQYTIVCE